MLCRVTLSYSKKVQVSGTDTTRDIESTSPERVIRDTPRSRHVVDSGQWPSFNPKNRLAVANPQQLTDKNRRDREFP